VKGSRSAVVATVVAALFWGSSFSVIKIGLRSINPYWFVFLRFAFASIVACTVVCLVGKRRDVIALIRRPAVLFLGVTNALGFLLQFKGQTLTTAGNAALLINVCTIFVAIASRYVFRERFGIAKIIAVCLGMFGVFLVTTGGRLSITFDSAFRGDMLVMGAAGMWTFFIILDKLIVSGQDVDVRALTAAMVTITAATALPAALLLGRGEFPRLTGEWWAIPYTSIFCTVIPFFLWTWGLRFITATTSSVVMLSEVVFALALAAMLLGERLSAGALLGSALIMLAVVLASRETTGEPVTGPDVVPE
jgi:drug/metabolite transporter (DMT)-like permease